jgi:carboxymethylenebutenolidase
MGIVGSADHWTPPDHVAELQATGAAVVIYEGADHGFVHDPSRPAHRADEAADAWTRALTFLAE